MSSEREAAKARFLKEAGLADAFREPLPGDASSRRYERIGLTGGGSLMLMDAPSAAESDPVGPEASEAARIAAGYNAMARLAGGRLEAFAAAAGYLRRNGLSAPQVVAVDLKEGLMLTEDFGDGLFARLIERGEADERRLYFAAVEALAQLHQTPPPTVLGSGELSWPLCAYDDLALRTGAELFVEWLPRLDPRVDLGADAYEAWAALWAPARALAARTPGVFTHRDYHAENLLWLPEREGVARVGMIDFQDCVLAHPSWDLHSLLQDARRDVSPELERAALDHYFALRPQVDRAAFMADYAALAALNEARIIGIFSRLITRDAKPRYAAFLPRMWRHLETNLAAPGLEPVRRWLDERVPVELRP